MDIKTRVRRAAAELRRLRKERGISRNQLADEAGVNVSQISRVEAGQDAKLSTWIKIYFALGYEPRVELQETSEEAELLSEEAERRRERREDGLCSGKRWR